MKATWSEVSLAALPDLPLHSSLFFSKASTHLSNIPPVYLPSTNLFFPAGKATGEPAKMTDWGNGAVEQANKEVSSGYYLLTVDEKCVQGSIPFQEAQSKVLPGIHTTIGAVVNGNNIVHKTAATDRKQWVIRE